jgi:HSP20 family protein
MANEQSGRQGERQGQSGAMERAGRGGSGLGTRQYQDPFSLFDSLFERMQRDFFGTSLLNALVPSRGDAGEATDLVRMPRMQMRDTGEELEVTAEMPGVDGANVSVQIEDDVLTISGRQRSQEERDQARMEREVSFYRQLPLPDGIDTENVQASYRNGMLSIRFPKTRARSSARQIPVSTEQQQEQQVQPKQPGRAA